MDSNIRFTNGAGEGRFSLPAGSTGLLYTGVVVRGEGSLGYLAKARVNPGGSVSLTISRVDSGSEVKLASAVMPGVTVRDRAKLMIQLTVQGTSPVLLRGRAWAEGGVKPSQQLTAQDSSPGRISTGGTLKAWSYLSGSARASMAVPFDGMRLVGATQPAPSPSTSKYAPVADPNSASRPTPGPLPSVSGSPKALITPPSGGLSVQPAPNPQSTLPLPTPPLPTSPTTPTPLMQSTPTPPPPRPPRAAHPHAAGAQARAAHPRAAAGPAHPHAVAGQAGHRHAGLLQHRRARGNDPDAVPG
jgi:hypothetical protein